MQGSCLCGEIRFEVDGPFPWLYQCHCSLCRKQGGSVTNTGLIVAADKFRWLAGEGLISKWQRATGFRSHFCSRCGAPVPNPLRSTGYVWVPSGLLDGDEPLEIGMQLYVDSRAPWATVPADMPRHETAPPLDELIAWLHSQAPSS
ncbi:MAG: GFA family protein [Gammaproteobacteria bacterium]